MTNRHSTKFTRVWTQRRTRFLLGLLAVLPGVVPVEVARAADAPRRPPNVVFLLSDDQRPDTLAIAGNNLIRTPNLDRLARSGSRFTRATCAYPLCVPSRAEILSGCIGFTNGIYPRHSNRLNTDLTLWPAAMQSAGYVTWHVGKWHVAGRPTTRGYSDSNGLFAGGGVMPDDARDHAGRPVTGYRGWIFQSDDGKKFAEKGVGLTATTSETIAEAAIELIQRKPDRPFFLCVNFTAPHDPLHLPPGYGTMYDPAAIPLPKNFLAEHPFDHGNFRGRDELLFAWPRTAQEVKRELAAYYAVISHLDAQVGRILETLKATGQAENTIVVFASDHGLAIGSHGLRGKQNMYEHTIGVPLILSGPGIPKDKQFDAQCYLRDLYPTICDLAGVPIPRSVEAKSLVPVLRGEQAAIYSEVFGYFDDSQRMIRSDRWKLITYPQRGASQLFDLHADPDEMHDLINDPGHAATAFELRKRLAEWQRQVKDPLRTQ